MARSKRNKELDRIEVGIKLVMLVLVLIALLGGPLNGFVQRLISLIVLVVLGAVCIAAIVGIWMVARRSGWFSSAPSHRRQHGSIVYTQPRERESYEDPSWDSDTILERMEKIDWYQFEKFCAAILQAEGYSVDRKGGAQPDGGVDLIVSGDDGNDTLIQCKHWRTWKVGEPVVRQMLGSMTDFGVKKGAIYSIKRWTQPAADFAHKHSIQMVDGAQLAERALDRLSPASLNQILNNDTHHCPKCEAKMVLRTGNFKSFWGCSTFPRCRGTIKAA